MNAMQRYKVQSGKAFPSYGEVLRVAFSLGYRRLIEDHSAPVDEWDDPSTAEQSAPSQPNPLAVV